MKSFTNVHVIFNFAIGKKKNLVTRYILNGERDVFLLSFHPQFHAQENWMTSCISIQICFPVFFLIPTLSPSSSSLATSLNNFLQMQSRLLGKAGLGEAMDLTEEASIPRVHPHGTRAG